jgi:hypothetical protein
LVQTPDGDEVCAVIPHFPVTAKTKIVVIEPAMGPRKPGVKPALTTHTPAPERGAALWAWLFVLFQIGCQLALLVEFLGGLRVVVRSAAFGISILLLLLVPGSQRRHPACLWLLACLAIVCLSIAHPYTNSLPAGFATVMFYVAVAAPLFWVCRLRLTGPMFRRIILTLWLFHTASAAVGVLQMYYPGRFQPTVSTAIQGMGVMADAYKIRLADGQMVWRPMGLTDTPGGAASAGLYAVLFGLGMFLQARAGLLRVATVGSLGIGLFCLYMSQVRSLVVMAGVCSTALVGVLVWRGDVKRVVGVTLILLVVSVAAFQWASRVGGADTVNRLNTLVEDRATEVYGRNRGLFLESTFVELAPQYPLGAGLGRWGMIWLYFGDHADINIWVEIQWTAWLLDGGIPLMILYPVAVVIACWVSLRVALSRLSGNLPLWGALLFALNMATIAVTFNYPIFMAQGGMEFWFLNGCLFAAAIEVHTQERRIRAQAAASRSSAPQIHSHKPPVMVGPTSVDRHQ